MKKYLREFLCLLWEKRDHFLTLVLIVVLSVKGADTKHRVDKIEQDAALFRAHVLQEQTKLRDDLGRTQRKQAQIEAQVKAAKPAMLPAVQPLPEVDAEKFLAELIKDGLSEKDARIFREAR